MSMNARSRFHFAFPVLAKARAFDKNLLGCREGRSSGEWVGFDFFGRVAHLSPNARAHKAHNRVDEETISGRRFGVIFVMQARQVLADKLKRAHVDFVIAPGMRFDPDGNVLEFKTFHDETRIFAP